MLGVTGSSGGLGVSSLCVALAIRAAAVVGATACVDHTVGGGLDVTACLEHLPGVRWGDLTEVRGAVDGAALLGELPSYGAAHVLGMRGRPPSEGVVGAVVEALAVVCGVTVLDLGRGVTVPAACTELILVSGVSARQLADASAVVAGLVRAGDGELSVRLVLRMGRREPVSPEEVASHLDLPLAAVLFHDARVVGDADRGRPPGLRGVLASVADRVLMECGAVPAASTSGARR